MASEREKQMNVTSDTAQRIAPWRPLWPREHGAYGELVFPTISVMLLGRATLASISLALAAVALFVAHESVLVLLGQRGKRVLEAEGTRARFGLVLFCAIAAVSGSLGLSAMPSGTLHTIVPPLALACVVVAFVIAKREKTLVGEVMAAAALTAPSYPVAIAAGVAPKLATTIALLWLACFTLSVLAVRGLIATRKAHSDKTTARASAVASTLTLVAGITLVSLHRIPVAMAVSVAPFAIVSLWLFFAPPHPKHLRAIGWGLISASVLTCAVIAVGLR